MGNYIFILLFICPFTLHSEEVAIPLVVPDPTAKPAFTEAIESFDAWLEKFWDQAIDQGISEETLKRAKKYFVFDPKVIALDRKQPEGMLDFDTYYQGRVPPRIKEAQKLYEVHKKALQRIETKYQVPGSVIVALWGMESNFGKLKGKYVVLGSLATLAYEGRRAAYFTKELINALKIIQDHKIQHQNLKGSWAGAMGHCQFMPSTYLDHATRGDEGATPDIWDSLDHVFASMGNYLHNLGWNLTEPTCLHIELPQDFDIALIAPGIKKTWKEWKDLGVRAIGTEKLDKSIIGYLQKAPLTDKVYLAFNNYELLLKWNKSNNFALSIGLFAERLERS